MYCTTVRRFLMSLISLAALSGCTIYTPQGMFEVTETRGHIDDQKIEHYQVKLKIGFTMDE